MLPVLLVLLQVLLGWRHWEWRPAASPAQLLLLPCLLVLAVVRPPGLLRPKLLALLQEHLEARPIKKGRRYGRDAHWRNGKSMWIRTLAGVMPNHLASPWPLPHGWRPRSALKPTQPSH